MTLLAPARHSVRIALGTTLVAITFLAAPAAADDFGKFLDRAKKEMLKDQLSPQHLDRLSAQHNLGETHPVKTQDGWTLVAHRFRPKGAPKPGADPVILCHGLGYNALFWNLNPACSLPDYLTSNGYDVWVVDLRGCGSSQKWVWKLDDTPSLIVGSAIRNLSGGKVAPTGYATIDPKYANWSLDHHIYFDVPAFVNLVKRKTGAQNVTWIGHSMGGIVALGHLGRFPNPGIGRLVTIGSQVTMPDGQIIVQFAREMLKVRELQVAGGITGKQLADASKTSVDNLFFNERNSPPDVYTALSSWAKDVPSAGLMKQYMSLAETGELIDSRRQFNYAKSLGKITIPVLITCGAVDQLAPPTVQQFLYNNIGSTDKTVVIFGRQSGFAVDSGHNDSVVGNNSKAQVYPVIERWMSGARKTAAR
ncbi:MAG: alpha/beta fold hydrolase [Isosphaeraceae bacterium]|nr:alpha/beta fold hydrolase [Isosphaeraceae bacterium]